MSAPYVSVLVDAVDLEVRGRGVITTEKFFADGEVMVPSRECLEIEFSHGLTSIRISCDDEREVALLLDRLDRAAREAIEQLHAAKVAAASLAGQLGCTGKRYVLNRSAPEEGTDIWHDAPCPAHLNAHLHAVDAS